MGSYEAWSEVMGGVLLVAGISGFLHDRDRAEVAVDPEEAAWAAFFDLWWDASGDRPVGVSELFARLQREPDLLLALDLGDRGVQSQKTQLGLKLKHRAERLLRGRRLERAGSVQNAVRWRLAETGR